MSDLILFGRPLPDLPPASALPDWQQADPRWMASALQIALGRSGGGWFVVDERRRFGSAGRQSAPLRYRIDDRELVFWHGPNGLMAAPDACPHMGASLAAGCVRQGRLVCPWHGLELGDRNHGTWRPLPLHDDGVLVWVRLDDAGEAPTEHPFLPVRPDRYIDAVVRLEARCRPEDLIANRLDPWHGVHYHPHTFRRLRVVERRDDEITVRVAFAVVGRLAVEVDARFHCPDPRTIVMTIVQGDGDRLCRGNPCDTDQRHPLCRDRGHAGHLRPAADEVRAAACPLGAPLARAACVAPVGRGRGLRGAAARGTRPAGLKLIPGTSPARGR